MSKSKPPKYIVRDGKVWVLYTKDQYRCLSPGECVTLLTQFDKIVRKAMKIL